MDTYFLFSSPLLFKVLLTAPCYSDDKGVWEMEAQLEGHTNWVRDVAWAPDTGFTTSTIASCCHDGKVIIWQCKDLDKAAWDSKVNILYKHSLMFWFDVQLFIIITGPLYSKKSIHSV